MADDEKKKIKLSDVESAGASTIGKIVKVIKYLANPIIFWIAVALLILVFIISLWGFIESMPGNAMAKIRALFPWYDDPYNVTDEDIKKICVYIEDEMGYDLEKYGFIEKITRKANSDGSKGEIEKVESKYLNAYIVANKELYNFADTDYEKGLILLEGSKGVTDNGFWSWISFWNHDVRVETKIDKDNEWFVTKIPDDAVEALFGNGARYGYDLREWTCKYGKPTEFLIAVHLATGAPDFVYKIATEPEVDTKVHMQLYPTKATFELVDQDGNAYNTISSNAEKKAIDELKNSDNYTNAVTYINATNNAIDTFNKAIMKTLQEIGSEDNYWLIYFKVNIPINIDKYNTESFNDYYSLANGDFQNILNNILEVENVSNYYEPAGLEDYMNDIESYLTNIKRNANTAYNYLNNYINEIKNKKVSIEVGNGQKIEISAEDLMEVEKFIEEYLSKEQTVVTPYITKVIQHWYRNQYFVLKTYEEAEEELIQQGKPHDTLDVINEMLNGGAYEVGEGVEIPPYPIPFSSEQTFGVTGSGTRELLEQLRIKETRETDIVQVQNPLFKDNSYFIRSWLKQKYYIYGDDNTQAKEGETTILDENKMKQGKRYIDGKSALEKVKTMLENCEDRPYIKYMERDFVELLEDFEFDLENTDILEEKVLQNVMPDYVPYTPWPSVFEEGDGNYTKMIYKTNSSAKLVAPLDGTITKVEGNAIEIKFENVEENDKKTSVVDGFTLRIESDDGISSSLGRNQKVKTGEKIGEASSKDGIVTVKLYLFTQEKGILPIKKYMSVPSKQYENLDKDEITLLNDLLRNLVNASGKVEYVEQGEYAEYGEYVEYGEYGGCLLNIIFNRIVSPSFVDCYDIKTSLNSVLNDDLNALKLNIHSSNYISDNVIEHNKSKITQILDGIDYTKNRVPIGATRYYEKLNNR